MDVREKLVELLGADICKYNYCEDCECFENEEECFATINYSMADHLIANGVTVQEWISVKDRLPEPWKQVLIYSLHDFCESAVYIGVPGKWRVTWNHEMLDADSVTHWMPLPLPPKGE